MDLALIFSTLMSVIGVFVLGLTYTYIDKLEKTGCACAEHKYRNFIKNFALFAIAFLLLTTFFPPAMAYKMFGASIGKLYAFAAIPFFLATIVFFVMAIVYVRYLINEKCKCSEDVRREILYYWAILEIIMISALFVLPILGVLVAGSVATVANAVDAGQKGLPAVRSAVVDPVSSAMKVGKSMKKGLKKLRK